MTWGTTWEALRRVARQQMSGSASSDAADNIIILQRVIRRACYATEGAHYRSGRNSRLLSRA